MTETAADPAETEARNLLRLHGSFLECQRLITHQFDVIQSRTQALMGLATLTLTITGFSGPRIAASNPVSRWTMIAGLALVLVSVVAALTGTFRIRWLTQIQGDDDADALARMIGYRDAKTAQYRRAMAALAVGLVCYITSVIAYMLSDMGRAHASLP